MNKLFYLFFLSLVACSDGSSGNQPYSDTSRKTQVSCPSQTSQTLVLMTFGQSNSANALQKRYQNSNSRIINYFNGKCYIAADPLLGATGDGGSQWVVSAQKLISTQKFDFIVINSFGVGGSGIKEWVNNPSYRARYQNPNLGSYFPTHFLWHQGETDALEKTSPEIYQTYMNQIIHDSLQNFPTAKFYVSLATVCNSSAYEPIRDAQRAVWDNIRVFPGPDTDLMFDRYDGCHLGQNAQEEVSNFWREVINLE